MDTVNQITFASGQHSSINHLQSDQKSDEETEARLYEILKTQKPAGCIPRPRSPQLTQAQFSGTAFTSPATIAAATAFASAVSLW
jgi:hypothetical protein